MHLFLTAVQSQTVSMIGDSITEQMYSALQVELDHLNITHTNTTTMYAVRETDGKYYRNDSYEYPFPKEGKTINATEKVSCASSCVGSSPLNCTPGLWPQYAPLSLWLQGCGDLHPLLQRLHHHVEDFQADTKSAARDD